jgi:hypothetical protein
VVERFVPLAAFVRGAASAAAPVGAIPSPTSPARHNVIDFAHADVVHELTLLTLAAREAFSHAAARLLGELASEVLARELLLAPADIIALVERALAAFAQHAPVAIAVSAQDAERVRAAVPVRIDSGLGAGDLIVDVRDGTFESTFAFRLEDAVARAAGAG